MSIDALKNQIPDYAKDIKLNLSSLSREEALSSQQLWGTFLSCALATGNAEVIRQIEEEALDNLSAAAVDAAKYAALAILLFSDAISASKVAATAFTTAATRTAACTCSWLKPPSRKIFSCD